MKHVLCVDLGISAGDKIFITSAFGALNAQFSPFDLVKLLMEIVTPDGMILMPYYPPGTSAEWADSGVVFDMQKTKSAMGVVTNVFSNMENVHKSIHPTKSIVGWGNGIEDLLEGHESTITPFSADSPYGKFLKLKGSKSIGLGVGKFPMGHCMEDIVSEKLTHYRKERIIMKVKTYNNEINVSSLVHDENRGQIPPIDFIKSCKYYKKVKVGYEYCFVIDNVKAYEFYKQQFTNGNPSFW